MAPPPSTAVSPIVSLQVRILTFVCLIISVILLVANSYTPSLGLDVKIKFNDFYAYRYLLAATVIGIAYTLLQTAFTIFLVSTGNRIGGEGMLQFDFCGDKVISYVLATGAAASFGLTGDLKNISGLSDSGFDKFVRKADAATSLCLLGFLFTEKQRAPFICIPHASFTLMKGVLWINDKLFTGNYVVDPKTTPK